MAESSLQAELASIGHEISNSRASPVKARPTSSNGSSKSISPTSSSPPAAIVSRVQNLSDKVTVVTSDLTTRTAALEKDIENSLIVSERRAKKLDELYRAASAENEALYQRFNDELSRIAKDVKHGNGEAALREQLRETLDELARAKKENLRLKREIGGLKAQQVIVD